MTKTNHDDTCTCNCDFCNMTDTPCPRCRTPYWYKGDDQPCGVCEQNPHADDCPVF